MELIIHLFNEVTQKGVMIFISHFLIFFFFFLFFQEVESWKGGVPKFSKYMDSFPFPYYIVLRNIDALPRTLADLLRQVIYFSL